jgi:hypothetical protein
MRKLLTPFLVCIPALVVFVLIHWPTPGSTSAIWWQHYESYSGHGIDPALNPLFRIETLNGGWGTFWRDAWASWGVVWILALCAWPRARLLWKVMFIVLFIGCFIACMVSYDKGRLWIRMAPVLLPMVVEWVAGAEIFRERYVRCLQYIAENTSPKPAVADQPMNFPELKEVAERMGRDAMLIETGRAAEVEDFTENAY